MSLDLQIFGSTFKLPKIFCNFFVFHKKISDFGEYSISQETVNFDFRVY